MKRTLYLICTTSRTGSTHLCQLLTATGRLGTPDEYFNPPLMDERMREQNLNKEYEYVQYILATTSTPNGVCGIKLATDALARLRGALGPIFELLPLRCIWLRRRDTLRQAISLYRAAATGVWHWPAGEPRPAASAAFDAARIRACEAQIAAANGEWSRWFAQSAIDPLDLWYEDFAARPRTAIQAICRHVGVASDKLPPLASDLCILRDEVTQAWAEQMSAEC